MKLIGERIYLRDHVESDLHDFHRWISDPDVMAHLTWKTATLEQSRSKLLESISEARAEDRIKYFFAIVRKSDDQYLGDCGFTMLGNNQADIGYFLLQKYTGNGYASEAIRILTEFGFEELKLEKICASCSIENHKSESLMKNIGMIKDQNYSKQYLHNGRLIERVSYYLRNEVVEN